MAIVEGKKKMKLKYAKGMILHFPTMETDAVIAIRNIVDCYEIPEDVTEISYEYTMHVDGGSEEWRTREVIIK